MRYMMLIYSRQDASASPEQMREIAEAHGALMQEAQQAGIFRGAEPLAGPASATTVRKQGSQVLVTDGPFAETKEQIAGYYILECRDLDEAVEWAARIPVGCFGAPGYVEIRPIRSTQP